jgi:histidine triad (HIT) family protein
LFCRIVSGEAPARLAYDDDATLAFHDINPQAPTHVLVIPREHHPDLAALTAAPGGGELLHALMLTATRIASEQSLDGPGAGWRLVTNTGPLSGQSVHHLHFHVLGGRPMRWPPG